MIIPHVRTYVCMYVHSNKILYHSLALTLNCRSILLSLTPPPPLAPGVAPESDSKRESALFSWAAKMAAVCGCDSTVPVNMGEGVGCYCSDTAVSYEAGVLPLTVMSSERCSWISASRQEATAPLNKGEGEGNTPCNYASTHAHAYT